MQWKSLALALFVQHGFGQNFEMMRFSCSQLVIDRIDPLVNPGQVPSTHVHQIVGGNSFNASMDPATHDLPTESTCTSCTFSEDFSNYWTAVLYFRARNGTYKRVPQFVSEGLRAIGGITVYYIPPYDGKTKVTAFKPGFRMLVGDALLRSKSKDPKVCHRCMQKTGDASNIECSPPDTQALPKGFCEGGIRTVITFPTCWDGKNLDSPDHESHVAYPSSGNFDSGGSCPSTHPVKIPQVMYEVMWDVSAKNLSLSTYLKWRLGCLERQAFVLTPYYYRPEFSTIRTYGQKTAHNHLCGALVISEFLSNIHGRPITRLTAFVQNWIFAAWRLRVRLERRLSPARTGCTLHRRRLRPAEDTDLGRGHEVHHVAALQREYRWM